MAWQQVRHFSTFLLKNQSQFLKICRGIPLLRVDQKFTLVKTFSTTPVLPSNLELYEAVNEGLFDQSKKLIQKGANIHATDAIGQ